MYNDVKCTDSTQLLVNDVDNQWLKQLEQLHDGQNWLPRDELRYDRWVSKCPLVHILSSLNSQLSNHFKALIQHILKYAF